LWRALQDDRVGLSWLIARGLPVTGALGASAIQDVGATGSACFGIKRGISKPPKIAPE
jgi:hypothetical protein